MINEKRVKPSLARKIAAYFLIGFGIWILVILPVSFYLKGIPRNWETIIVWGPFSGFLAVCWGIKLLKPKQTKIIKKEKLIQILLESKEIKVRLIAKILIIVGFIIYMGLPLEYYVFRPASSDTFFISGFIILMTGTFLWVIGAIKLFPQAFKF